MSEIKTMSCDIETYSPADLAKTGVYRYAEDPEFEILLFGYSADGSDVRVIDLAAGEAIPEDVLDALTDNSVTKWAFNASFERVCLSRYLRDLKRLGEGEFLDPEGWRCTMVWAAYLGLPLSLQDVGAALNLDRQKLTEGKDLIRFFCKPCAPTLINGGRSHNGPFDAPDLWANFKAYNKRDVETESDIQRRLRNYPVPDDVWEQYHIDQEINDRGIAVDMPLVDSAIAMDGRAREELTARMRALTHLDNPNSTAQMKQWLMDYGVETESLGKKQVQELLRTAPPELRDALTLRQQLAKSSVKKYQAMKAAACSDSRCRGMFQFYGANRSGRWCLTGDHEVLTQDGWVRLDAWQGGHIASWNATSEAVSFQEARALVFDYEGPLYTYSDNRIDQTSTPDHRMRVQKRYGEPWQDMTVFDMSKCRPCIPMNGYRYHRGCANPAWLRVLIMTQADGFYTPDGIIRYHFKKTRKIERCKHLLRKAEIPYVVQANTSTTTITIPARAVPLWLREFRTKTFGFWLLDENPDIFFDELPNWDGYCPTPNSIQYSTCNRQNADIVQALAHMSGRCACMRVKKHSELKENWKDAYVLDIWLTPGMSHVIKNKPTIAEYSGRVYCAETATGYFLVRRHGKVWVTGNSGRNVQLQNLPQNHLPDLDAARRLVRAGDYESIQMLYGAVPDVLSELIRTAFVPAQEKRFIVADYSAIEARVIAWLAGEQWRMDLFKSGGDIYCQSASQMFKVPVVKHGVNGHLRSRGKVAELACIASDNPVLTDQGLVPIQDVTTDMKVWDGENWVRHDGVVYRGEREVMTYEGLTATPDHLVWVEGEQGPVRFDYAAASGARLVQTGDGRRAIRMGENKRARITMDKRNTLLCRSAMRCMPKNIVARLLHAKTTSSKDLSQLRNKGTFMAPISTKSSEAPMHEQKRSCVCELWRARNKIRFQKCKRRRDLHNNNNGCTRKNFGVRSDRLQRQLRRRKPTICLKNRERAQQKDNCINRVQARILAIRIPYGNSKDTQRAITRGDYKRCSEGGNRAPSKLAFDKRTARLYDIRNAGPHHRFTVSGKLVHNCGYGGGVGALKNMGALDMGLKEEELKPLVDAWRESNPNIVRLWWSVDEAAKTAVRDRTETHTNGLTFTRRSGMLFITLPSGRRLAYVQPMIGENRFGSETITYMGIGATKKWERIETWGPKIVENVTQAVSRDVLCGAMKALRDRRIVAHVHDELIIEAGEGDSLEEICELMGRTPEWAEGLALRADGYECAYYQKD